MKKYIKLVIVLFSFNSYAEDCDKVISDMESDTAKIEKLFRDVDEMELSILGNIFDPKIMGPHVPYIEQNKKELFNKTLPLRKQVQKASRDNLKSFIERLKTCKQKESDCSNQVNASSRGIIKPQSLDSLENLSNSVKTIAK